MTLQCKKCHQSFINESLLENHHYFPKSIGGTDKDGRGWFCLRCHFKANEMIVNIMLKYIPSDIPIKKYSYEYLKYPKILWDYIPNTKKDLAKLNIIESTIRWVNDGSS